MSAPGLVDTDSVDLGNGDSTTITLEWDTDAADEDDWDAVAESAFDSDSQTITIDSQLFTTVGHAPDAGGATARTYDSSRVATGSPPAEAAASLRTLTAVRDTAAGVASAATATTSRTLDSDRATVGASIGVGVATRSFPAAFGLPTGNRSDAVVLLTVSEIETDYDGLTIAGEITRALLESGALDHYRDAGDVVREPTAFGAFRRIPRDGSDAVTIEPSERFSPPFEERDVVPLDASIEQISPTRHRVELTLGLAEPRAREPIEVESEPEQIDSSTVSLDAGETRSITFSGTAPSALGDYVATVRTDSDSDTALVSVTDADVVISWPVATLGLTERQVGRIQRESDLGRERVTIPTQLSADQAAILVAVGSRVEAVRTRQTPDARNQLRDTLPGEELTANIDAPDALGSDVGGEAVLVDWSLSWVRPTADSRPVDAELTFVSLD